LAGNTGFAPSNFLLPQIMGKRSGLFFAILMIAGVVVVQAPVAVAQSSADDSSGCQSGITSSVDASCIGQDDTSLQDLSQQGPNQGTSPTGGNYGNYGANASGQLTQQYPGLQSRGLNGVPTFSDQSGLNGAQAQQQALNEARLLAIERPSPPTEFQLLVRASVGRMLPVYGDSLFRQVPTTFAPLRNVNVTPDYVLGPGDQLLVRIWGQVNLNAQVTVDRSGSVYLPQVGEIHVAGLPYAQVRQHIQDAVGRIFKSFDLEVEMGQLRSIQVFVVGQGRRPGNYTLSSLSTLVTALFATGGPSVQGSLRDIQLRRNGQTITHFDLYDLLLLGDMSKDAPLLSGDVIFIPPVGPQVAIAGSVRVPAIYELKGATTVDQALVFAGGLSSTASLLKASLERMDEHNSRTATNIELQGAGMTTQLRQGDILRVLPFSPEFQNTVTLRGNVAESGRFSWHPGMKLSDIIPDTKSLVTRDYWERRNQLGIPGPEFKVEYSDNPDQYPRDANGNRRPRPYNGAGIYENNQGQFGYNGTSGYNQNPGQYPNQNSSQNSNQNSNQYNQNSNQNSGPNPGNFDQALLPQLDSGQTDSNNPGNPGSSQNGGQNSQQTNDLGGASLANQQQQLSWNGGILPRPRLKVVLPVPEIDWSYAVIERFNPVTLTTSLVPFNPGKLIQDHDSSQDLTLEPGDVVTIFSQVDISVPQDQRTKFVRLEGEFKAAGIYSVHPGETLRELVTRAGGLTQNAYLFGSEFTRESTRVFQQQRLNDYLSNLELEIDRSTINAAVSSLTPQDTAATATEVSASRSLISKFRTLRATGRIVLTLDPNATGIDRLPDLPLEDGDRFTVPSRPGTVNVVGAVYDQNSFLFNQRQELKSYVRLAGGPTRDADDKHAFIIRADGSVVSRQSRVGVFGNTFDATRLNPGDTVVVPEKVPRPSALRNFTVYSQIFSSLALGAAAIAVLQ
jgi:protein involved in polysaccharide export with SLBB domain